MKKLNLIFVVALSLVLSLSLAGCGDKQEEAADTNDQQTEENTDAEANDEATEEEANDEATEEEANDEATEEEDAAAPSPEENAGFEEFPIGEEFDIEPFMHVAGVYFQPVDLYPDNLGLSPDKSNMHIEADISALEGNGLGFGAGDWIPFLQVDYEITNNESGEVADSGTFMPMSASDGPHYGANINLEEAGTYTVKFIIKDPSVNGYVIHVDEATGVDRHEWWKEPIVVTWDKFEYIPNEEW